MRITLVKKIKLDGQPCRKCLEVEKRLRDAGAFEKLDAVVIADERDPASEGMRLAARYGVNEAPFFVVERDDDSVEIHTVYFRFMKEVMGKAQSEQDELAELAEKSRALDFI
jgi:hypothetical protein